MKEQFRLVSIPDITENTTTNGDHVITPLILAKLSVVETKPVSITDPPPSTLLLTDGRGAQIACRLTIGPALFHGLYALFRNWCLVSAVRTTKDPGIFGSAWIEVDFSNVACVASDNHHHVLAQPLGSPFRLDFERLRDEFNAKQFYSPSLSSEIRVATLPSLSCNLRLLQQQQQHHTIFALIHAKSALQLNFEAIFILEVCDVGDGRLRSFIVFKGDQLVRFYGFFNVGQCYIFVNCRVQNVRTNQGGTKSVFLFGSYVPLRVSDEEAEKLSKENSVFPADYGNNASLVTHHPSTAAQTLSSTTLSYKGVVTHLIDSDAGLFLVDDKFVLSLRYNYSYFPEQPYRVGTKLRLDNIHVVRIHGDWYTIRSKLVLPSTHPLVENLTSSTACWTVFVACSFSSVEIVRLPGRPSPSPCNPKFAKTVTSPSEYSFVDAVCLEELCSAWRRKFPGAVSDANLFGDGQRSILAGLMRRFYDFRATRRVLLDEFIYHSSGACRVALGSGQSNVKSRVNDVELITTPPLGPFWKEVLKEIVDRPPRFCETDNEGQYYDTEQFSNIKDVHPILRSRFLLGVLDGDEGRGGLFLRDASGEIPVVVGGLTSIHLDELGHLWCFQRFEVVVERLGRWHDESILAADRDGTIAKAYLRLDWSLAGRCLVCLKGGLAIQRHRNPGPGDLGAPYTFVFQVQHVSPVKILYDVVGPAQLGCYVEGVCLAVDKAACCARLGNQCLSYTSLHPPLQTILDFDSAARNLRVLPALEVGRCYKVSVDSGSYGHLTSNTDSDSNPRSLAVGRGWTWRCIASGDVDEKDSMTVNETLTDLLGNTLSALRLHLDEPSRQLLCNIQMSFIENDRSCVLDVRDVLAWETCKSGDAFNADAADTDNTADTATTMPSNNYKEILSFRGVVAEKSMKKSWSTMPLSSEASFDAFDKLAIGTGKVLQTIFLRIEDIHGIDVVEVYLDNTSLAYPLGILPGDHVLFRRIMLNSTKNKVFCTTTSFTRLELDKSSMDECNASGNEKQSLRELETSFFVDILHDRRASRNAFKTYCRIISFSHVRLNWPCRLCKGATANHTRAGFCTNEHVLRAYVRCQVTDGTAPAFLVLFKESTIISLLRIDQKDWHDLKSKSIKYGPMIYDEEIDEGGNDGDYCGGDGDNDEIYHDANDGVKLLRSYCLNPKVYEPMTVFALREFSTSEFYAHSRLDRNKLQLKALHVDRHVDVTMEAKRLMKDLDSSVSGM